MNRKSTIFIDLDGTILDVSQRIYAVYRDILRGYKRKSLDKAAYIKLKQSKSPIENILKKTGAEDVLPKFKKEWRLLIENSKYLKLDNLSNKAYVALLALKKSHVVVLVTLRRSRKQLLQELKNKKLDTVFNQVIVCSKESKSDRWKLKVKAIKQSKFFEKKSIMVGDTETDIIAGKQLGFKTVAIVSGMRSKKYLTQYKPDIILKNIEGLLKCNF